MFASHWIGQSIEEKLLGFQLEKHVVEINAEYKYLSAINMKRNYGN